VKRPDRLIEYLQSHEAFGKDRLIGLYRKLHEIDDIQLTYPAFSRVQLHKNNSFYDFLIKICEIIYDNILIAEDPGKSKFRDFIQDERQMAYLFEEFVRNFYKIEVKDCRVSREDIYWDLIPTDDHSASYLPKMVTDISIERNDSKAVIDTKYYKEALTTYYDQEKIHSGHLFQIYAYLKNLEAKGGINKHCSGVLLYPTVDQEIRLNYKKDEHKIMIRTLNLNQYWKDIENDLKDLLDDALEYELLKEEL
jgi:5-methylcytosine-specific restriction enzyme subunit McrC